MTEIIMAGRRVHRNDIRLGIHDVCKRISRADYRNNTEG